VTLHPALPGCPGGRLAMELPGCPGGRLAIELSAFGLAIPAWSWGLLPGAVVRARYRAGCRLVMTQTRFFVPFSLEEGGFCFGVCSCQGAGLALLMRWADLFRSYQVFSRSEEGCALIQPSI